MAPVGFGGMCLRQGSYAACIRLSVSSAPNQLELSLLVKLENSFSHLELVILAEKNLELGLKMLPFVIANMPINFYKSYIYDQQCDNGAGGRNRTGTGLSALRIFIPATTFVAPSDGFGVWTIPSP